MNTHAHTLLRSTKLLVLVALIAFSFAPLVQQARADDDGILAGVVGNGTPASCDSNALQTALNGGGLVTFNCGPSAITIISNTYVISQNTTVDGGDQITLDGENLRQHFLVQGGATLTLRNIFLTRGNAPSGGSIFVNPNAAVNIRNVSFLNNSASDSGGAIYSNGGTLTIVDARFIQNKTPMNTIAVGYGGAIASLGTMTLYNGYFGLNEGRFGGAVFVGGTATAARASIDASTFTTNKAGSIGGGLYTNADTTALTVTNSVFGNNNSVGVGGGFARFNASVWITNTSFRGNSATSGGGMNIASGPTPNVNWVYLTSVTISGNNASSGQGGGIYNTGQVQISNATIVSNTNGVFNFGSGEQMRLRNTALQNPSSLNCDGDGTTPSYDGSNRVSDNSCGAGFTSSVVADIKIGPLQTLAFPTGLAYHLPQAGSPLINAGTTDSSGYGCPSRDQIRALRPDQCDIGAVEFGGLLDRAQVPLVAR
jgi:predicted outer membrane repeat protein